MANTTTLPEPKFDGMGMPLNASAEIHARAGVLKADCNRLLHELDAAKMNVLLLEEKLANAKQRRDEWVSIFDTLRPGGTA